MVRLDPDPTAVQVDDPAGDGQPEPCSATVGVAGDVGPVEYVQVGLCPKILAHRMSFMWRDHPLRVLTLFTALANSGGDPYVLTELGDVFYMKRSEPDQRIAMRLLEGALAANPEQLHAPQLLAYVYRSLLEKHPNVTFLS